MKLGRFGNVGSYLRYLRAHILAARARPNLAGATQLQLGCGPNVLTAWANIDSAGGPGVISLDLRYALPVANDSVAHIYSEHFLEHIDAESGFRLLRECFRVLRQDGRIRISTPDLQVINRLYIENQIGDWRDVGWNPETPCQMVNEAMRSWGHAFLYDFSELSRCLRNAGFENIERSAWHESTDPVLQDLERRPDHGDLIVEARKPRASDL